ncbi:serine/threonine-protein kinase [Paraliomyxa miuraensis]|uniref:serine/threonine-protein kinase n=1 Tax=Paraliomyxa miuraensis TaxID=376150 RepID=UPI0022503408|nr:serine/threonine-protein kinase [Paraliomyxa miuraensis]MCX4243349.1 serine/threonine protein kinase [Paraliomyxa miuraensis]
MELAEIASAPTSLAPGATIGRYQIIRRLQKGGMAELYLARQLAAAPGAEPAAGLASSPPRYEKIVALKRVLPHLAEDAAFVRMFLNEARLAAGLDHGNIAHVLDFGSQGPEHYLVLEYVHGCSVLELLKEAGKHGGLSLPCALTIVHEVAAALHYAHDKAGPDGRPLGLVHRDVSPSNVLVSYDGEVKLVDFGIAKATAHTRVTQSGTIKGKLAYMAPEQVRGETLDRRADVFSLAVVMYELCTGRRCFVAPGEFALINRVAAGKYERPSAIRPGFPEPLERIIARGLAVAIEERFESARALQLAIEEFAEDHGLRLSKLALADAMVGLFGHVAYPTTQALPAPVPPPTSEPTPLPLEPVTRSRRSRATGWLAAGALGLGLGLGLGGPRLWSAVDEEASEPDEPTTVDDPPGPGPTRTPPAPSDPVPIAAPASPDAEDPTAADDDALVLTDDDAPTGARRRSGRRKARKTKAAASETSTKTATEYLPPSRRSDGG